MTKANRLNTQRVMEAMANPTPDNKYLRDQYRFSYPAYNRVRVNAERMKEKLQQVHEGRVLVAHGSHYQHLKAPLQWSCTCCGHIWTASPQNVITDARGCPVCAKANKTRKPPTRLTDEERQRIRDLAASGATYKEMVKLTGRSNGTIQRVLLQAIGMDPS